MLETQGALLADLIIDGKKSKDSGLYISEMTFNEGISQVSKAILTICSNSLCLKVRGKKDQNGEQAEEGLLDYLDKKATICFLDEEKISRTFTGKITSVTHLGVSNTASGNLYKYEFIIEPSIADMRQAHHVRQIKKTIKEALEEILSTYYGNADIDFVIAEANPNVYLFSQWNETDYDFFVRLLTQFGLSFFVCSKKNLSSDEYYEQIIISDGKSFELPVEIRTENSHTDRNLNILVNKSSKTKSENIRISSWQMSSSTTIDKICRTDSSKSQENGKRLWFLDSLSVPHSETQTDTETREKIASNYLDSIRCNSATWFGEARLNDFQATDILNVLDFYSPCNLDSDDKEKSALLSEDTVRARIISLSLELINVLPFEVTSPAQAAFAEVKFRCAEISKEAPSVFTNLVAEKTLLAVSAENNTLSSGDSKAKLEVISVPVSNNAEDGLSLRKATVCYNPDTPEADLKALPKKNANTVINTDKTTGECYFYAKIDDTSKCEEVLFTMPLAGLGQGLYRYPRIGERILVLGRKDSRCVLHSYLPDSNTMPFFQYCNIPSDDEIRKILEEAGELKDLSEEQIKQKIEGYKTEKAAFIAGQQLEQSVATVLRHSSNDFMNGTSEANVANTYLSEESSGQFTPALKPLDREVKGLFEPSDYATKDIKYSEIGMYSGYKYEDAWIPETLRIQTPGNQFNHTGLMNINTANSFIFTTPNATQENLNYGGFQVIDVGSVIIDARRSITLKVGGNMISISESGVNIISQSTCTESTPYDSILSLSPIGASLSGLDVSVSGKISTNVSDGLGASMALAKGGVAINGHTVDLNTVDHASINFDIFCSAWETAQYAARFIADQVNMKKRLDIGYNDMVKEGYFDPMPLVYRMTGRTDAETKGLATYNAIWAFIILFTKSAFMCKSVFPPMRGKLSVFVAEILVSLLLGIFDAVMALLSADVWGVGALKDLTPEKVQRQSSITNFIKIVTKAIFVGIKLGALKSYKNGDISYLMIDPEKIETFSTGLTADFVDVKTTAHNVPLNPFTSGRFDGLPDLLNLPNGPAKAAQENLQSTVAQMAGTGSAFAFEAIKTASSLVPTFALKSSGGAVGLDSKALREFKADILTGMANFDITSASTTVVNAKAALRNKIQSVAPFTALEASASLDILSSLKTNMSCGPNSITLDPASMKVTSALLDMQTTSLLMKAAAALKLEGATISSKAPVVELNGTMVNVGAQLLKA